MRITLDQVEELRKKIDCDYATAEKALRKSKGNFNDAVLYLKKRENNKVKKLVKELEGFLNQIFSYNLIMIKNEVNIIHFPLVLILLCLIIFNIPVPILLTVSLAAILADYSFEIARRNDKVSSSITATNIQEEPDISQEELNEKGGDISLSQVKESFHVDDDGFYEITVE